MFSHMGNGVTVCNKLREKYGDYENIAHISTFYMIYTKKALRDRRIPFDIEAPADPFYSAFF